MKRGDSQLKRTGKLNQVSDRRKKENVKRRVLTRDSFEADPYCHLGPSIRNVVPDYRLCQNYASALHELQKRSAAGSITDPENCLGACTLCNGFIEDCPEVAWRSGLVLRNGDTYEDLERRRNIPETHEAWLERKGSR